MTPNWDRLEDLPLRFVVPDGWRHPDPQWVSLYQGFNPPTDWQPYPDAPPVPPNWPWWEENGASWYTFFRYHAPPPSRALGWWFALGASGLFTLTVSPFALGFPTAFIPGALAIIALVIGVVGIVRTLRRSTHWVGNDPMDRVRRWAHTRREEFFQRSYDTYRLRSSEEQTRAQFEASMWQKWWRENGEAAAN